MKRIRFFTLVLAAALLLCAMPALAVSNTVTLNLTIGTQLTLTYVGTVSAGSGRDLKIGVSGFGNSFFTRDDGTNYCPVELRIVYGLEKKARTADWVEMSTTGTYTFHFDTGISGFSQLYVRDATKPYRTEKDFLLLYDSDADFIERSNERARREAERRPDEAKRQWTVRRFTVRAVSGDEWEAERDFLAEGVEKPGTLDLMTWRSAKGETLGSFDATAAMEGMLDGKQLTSAKFFLEALSLDGITGWHFSNDHVVLEPSPAPGMAWSGTLDETGASLLLSIHGNGMAAPDDTGRIVAPKLEAELELMPSEDYKVALAESIKALIENREYYVLGHWEQDGDAGNGPEPIEWMTLESDDETATLISRYVLAAVPYNETLAPVTWENSTIRKWLNDDFLNGAFTPEEQLLLEAAEVIQQPIDDPYFEDMGDPGNDTVDVVYLPDRPQFRRWFTANGLAVAFPTAAAVAEGVMARGDNGECSWWIRPIGQAGDGGSGIWVSKDGSDCIGMDVNATSVGVRPVITVRLTEAGELPEPEA